MREKGEYKVRLVILGGTTDVTKNMYVYEIYRAGKLQDILIVDCGIGFPEEQELGIDVVIPDISYLKDKKNYIRAVLLTHGHEDHISALPFHFEALGKPKIYATKLTKVFLESKFQEVGIRATVEEVKYGKPYYLGDFEISYIHLTHSIPDTAHIVIKTPVGTIYHGSDFKFDLTPPYEKPPDFYKILKAGKEGILCLLTDCLGIEREGLTLSEKAVGATFEEEMRKTRGKFIMTTFSSNISRIRQCMDAAAKLNRKVAFLGRSMKTSTKIAKNLGYLPLYDRLVIREEQIPSYPPHKLCLIVAGSQAQFDSALVKLANGRNPYVKITSGDKVLFSSDPIPGNESQIYALIEQLSELKADVVYSNIHEQLHASGHGNQEDLKLLVRFTQPKYIIPIGGTLRHQYVYQKYMSSELSFDKNKILLLKEGQTVWFEPGKAYKGERIETKNVFVDAMGVGDVGNVVLQDRKTLAKEGFVNVVLLVNQQGKLIKKPEIISRGFVFEPIEKDLFNKATSLIQRILKPKKGKSLNINLLRKEIKDALTSLFLQEKGRSPLIVITVIQV